MDYVEGCGKAVVNEDGFKRLKGGRALVRINPFSLDTRLSGRHVELPIVLTGLCGE